MQVFREVNSLTEALNQHRESSSDITVGFVPTMGALHEGHIGLINNALGTSDVVVCSIFVNPTQFNNTQDLEKYPRSEEIDLEKLREAGCDYVYLPNFNEIYPEGTDNYEIDLGILDSVMEGAFRPGHFKGVAMVVERFFELVKPDIAFFGEKDYQQTAVIRRMIELRNLEVQMKIVPTVRASEGLALSSRNQRLSDEQKDDALIIYKTMQECKAELLKIDDPKVLEERGQEIFHQGNLELEYLSIVDEDSLQYSDNKSKWRIFIAAYCGEVRLIDNMSLTN